MRLPNLNLLTNKLKSSFNYELGNTKRIYNISIMNQADISVSVVIQSVRLENTYGHQVRFQLSDQSIASHSASVTFKNVSRGKHNFSVSVDDRNGSAVSPATSIAFHLKRFLKKRLLLSQKLQHLS